MRKIKRREFLKIFILGGVVLIGEAACIRKEIKKSLIASTTVPATDAYLPSATKSASNNVVMGTSVADNAILATDTQLPTVTKRPGSNAGLRPIIADHTIVDSYQHIPQEYKNLVKKMFLNIPGESHSKAYQSGCELLEALDHSFQVTVIKKGAPEVFTDQYLRISSLTWGDVDNTSGWIRSYGEEDWFTSSMAIQRTKDHIDYCNTHNLTIAAIGLGWCWDMSGTPEGGIDPVYGMHWAGSSIGGPDGNRPWGLDTDDYVLTENHVCMDTYLNATIQYMDHCQKKGYSTKVFFTTGPVDSSRNTGESGYQRELKHEYIREFVKKENNCVLFDYADILCWSDINQQNVVEWVGSEGTKHTYPYIHDDNMMTLAGSYSDAIGHIGERGALRLAKALWWMLARIAGWDGK